METVLDSLARGYVALIANIGLLAILAWCVSLFGRHLFVEDFRPSMPIASLLGITFGVASALLMYLPVEFQPGIFGDARGAPLMMSGLVGGPVSMAFTMLIAAITRGILGGTGGMAGIIAILIYAGTGYLWRVIANRLGRTGISTPELFSLAFLGTALTSPVVLLMPANIQLAVLSSLWPKLWVANVIGILILGSLIRREVDRQKAEHELTLQKALSERATVAKSKFLAAMSHEIRTPLNGILGIIQLLMSRPLDKEIRHDLKIAQDSGFFLLSLLNQVLDFARIESGTTTIEKKRFSVAALADGLHSIFTQQASLKGLEFSIELTGPTDREIYGDYDHIRQVLFNLLGNAVKFTEQGEIILAVRQEREEDYYRLRFEVRDTGPGIPDSDLGLIFEEFKQSESAAENVGGSGLGLSIALQLATAMGGALRVDSKLGEGTCFTLMVVAENPPPLQEAQPGRVLIHSGRPRKILVVEDNAINQRITRGLLEEIGCTVTIAANGEEAVRMASTDTGRYDLILMDIQMPVMDGLEATRRIRALPGSAGQTPIIALTANAFEEQRAEYIAAGMNDVLIKPLRREELRKFLPMELAGGAIPAAADTAPETAGLLDKDILGQVITTLSPEGARSFLDDAGTRSASLINRLKHPQPNRANPQAISHELRSLLSSIGFCEASEIARKIEYPDPEQEDFERLVNALETSLARSMTQARAQLDGNNRHN